MGFLEDIGDWVVDNVEAVIDPVVDTVLKIDEYIDPFALLVKADIPLVSDIAAPVAQFHNNVRDVVRDDPLGAVGAVGSALGGDFVPLLGYADKLLTGPAPQGRGSSGNFVGDGTVSVPSYFSPYATVDSIRAVATFFSIPPREVRELVCALKTIMANGAQAKELLNLASLTA